MEVSHDSIYWENDASYEYYRHGPLSRMLLGENRVQGFDYAYTIQGWLKGVNGTAVLPTFDMGGDGSGTSSVARDAFGFSLNYYNGDYKPISSIVTPFATVTNNLPVLTDGIHTGNDLFNGNIRAMLVNVPQLGSANLYAYRYDQLNRIKAMNSFTGFNNSTNLLTTPAATENYKERVTYDPNGNIRTYLRNGDAARVSMDNLAYTYKTNTNQLDKVVDAATDAAAGDYDKYNDIKQGQTNGNYQYDAIGNLIKDSSEGISNISWNVYGKISSINKNDGSTINYSYDASGNRINKKVTSGGITKTTIYVRDASGNVISIYAQDPSINSGNLTQTEADMYGSRRLGVWNMSRDVSALSSIDYSNYSSTFERGNKFFELSNHLGNVLATISDKKVGVDTNSDGVIDYDTAEVVSANDYYPGGMGMPGRTYNAGSYAYGFNGKRMDNEVSGVGNQYDYGFRIYDPRLVRFKSVDPLTKKYPFYTPYQFAGNSPIKFIDLDGLEPANNPKAPGAKEKEAMNAVDVINTGAAYHDAKDNFFSRSAWLSEDNDIKGTYSCGPGEYKSDTKGDLNNRFNMKVYTGATLNVDESQASHTNKYEAFIVDKLLTNFTTGQGAENYNFPTNGIISSKFLSSDILSSALTKFKSGNKVESEQFNFGAKELGKDLLRTGTPFSITGLTGSGTITMVPNKDGVQIQIFNITSLTSGDILKNPSNDTNWPKSYVRDPDKTTPYGNISQTYNLFLPWSSPLLSK